MNYYFIYFVAVFILIRIFTKWDQKPNSVKTIVHSFAWEFFLYLPLCKSNQWYMLVMFLLVYHILEYFFEKRIKNIHVARIYQLLVFFIAGAFLFEFIMRLNGFNDWLAVPVKYVLLKSDMWDFLVVKSSGLFLTYAFGAFMLINEFNNIIRLILEKLKTDDATIVDEAELNRGKIIGVIERLIFFLFVITNQYSAIGFILTAKGITRYREMENKDFAEYVLIGTLLSSGFAIFWGTFVKWLVG